MYLKRIKIVVITHIKVNSFGYTLPFVLLLTTLLTGLFLFLFHALLYQSIDQKQKIIKKKLDYACYSAIQKILTKKEYLTSGIESFLAGNINVTISKYQNGLFYNLSATAINSLDSSVVLYTVAEVPSQIFNNALVLSKPNLRATVAGNTIIKGNILATTDNFSLGHIYGLKRTNKKFLQGKILVTQEIPSKKFYDSLFIRNLNYYSYLNEFDQTIDGDFIFDEESGSGQYSEGKRILIGGNMNIRGELPYHRSKDFLFFRVRGKIIIEANSISEANLVLICDSTVIVNEDVVLENCIIFSRQDIKIKRGATLQNVQIFSSKELTISNSDLLYPSVLGIYVDASDTASLDNRLKIYSSKVNGTVLLISSLVGLTSNTSRITIDKNSRIQGLVYCENDLELLGTVDGIVYTYNLYYYKEPTEYKNWLVGLKIDRSTLDENFLLPIGFTETSNLKILKETWIH